MRYVLLMLIAVFTVTPAIAQKARVKQYTTPLAGTAILADVEDKYNAQVFNLESPEPDAAIEQKKLSEIKEKMALMFPHRSPQNISRKTTGASMPTLAFTYKADSVPGIPPDNYMAINEQSQAVSMINTNIAVSNSQTGQIFYRRNLKTFTSAVGLNGLYDFRFDPKIMYDPEAKKFISIVLNGSDYNSWVVVGFSKTADPSGAWNFYKFKGDYANDSTWFDYPAISITKNEFFFTGNKIKNDSSWQVGFTQSVIYQIHKQDGYNGDTVLHYQIWDSIQYNGRSVRNLHPVKGGAGLKGPEQYFLSNRNYDVQNDTVFLIKVPDTLGSGNTNITVTPLISNIPYGVPPNGRQPDTSLVLATNDGRILGAYLEGTDIQFVSIAVDTGFGSAGIYHGVISNYASAPVLQASIYSVDSLDYGYPNISYTGNQGSGNHSIISFEYTGPNTFPGFGAIFFDGSQFSNKLIIKAGLGTINKLGGKEQRWGDYSGSQPDWTTAPESVWVEGIYGRTDHNYGNQIARILSPFATGIKKEINTVGKNAILYPNPSWQFLDFEFKNEEEQVFSFLVYDASGKMVDCVLKQLCKEGKNIMQFNVAPFAPGIYYLKVLNNNGKTISTQKFIKR